MQKRKRDAYEPLLTAMAQVLPFLIGGGGQNRFLMSENPRAHKNKSALPPPPENPKYPPPQNEEFYAEKGKIPGAPKIGAPISGPRIADKTFLRISRVGFWQNGFFADFYFLGRGFFRGFSRRIFSPHFCGEKSAQKNLPGKSPAKSSKKLHSKNPRHISAEGPGQGFF